MKRKTFPFAVAALLFALFAPLFTSCGLVDDPDWPYSPPAGWGGNYFYDSRLTGYWELRQADSQPVGKYETNYMRFAGSGRGKYYYYAGGMPRTEDLAYFCQNANSVTSNNLINLQYGDGTASTMQYWFSDGNDMLWLQWKDGVSVVTYLYARTRALPC